MYFRIRVPARCGRCAAALIALLLTVPGTRADVVSLQPVADNTLFSTDGATSNGAGPAVFSGRTGPGAGGIRQRGVLRFEVAGAVPAGATVTSVTLTLNLLSGGGPDVTQTITLHRLLADWGEGSSSAGGGQGAPSTPGDATWLHTFFPDQFWLQPGGDFDPAASAAADVGIDPAPYTWGSTPLLVADVQAWLDDPPSDHGWLLRGNEIDFNTARKFASREEVEPELRPVLTIEYAPASTCAADLDGDGIVGIHDLLAVLFAFGPCDGCPEDLSGNGVVNIIDLILVILHWGPCP
ncbi:MAG: DNRLRE domain-containing protein [Planctomycetota bacterium]|jgi:hypothetical protein